MAADTRSMHSLAYISCLLAHTCVHRTSYMRHAHARMSHILASCIRMYISFTSHHIYMCALFMCACVHASTPCVCVMDIMPRIYPCTLMPTLHIPNAPPWEHTLVDATTIHMQHHGHILTHAHAHIHTHTQCRAPSRSNFFLSTRLKFRFVRLRFSSCGGERSVPPFRCCDSPMLHLILPSQGHLSRIAAGHVDARSFNFRCWSKVNLCNLCCGRRPRPVLTTIELTQ